MNSRRRKTSQLLTWGTFLIGVVFLTLGLVFLVAAIQNPARLVTALFLIALGVGLAAWAGVRWRRAKELTPVVLDARITDLAATHSAQITLAQVVSQLDVPDSVARAALSRLERGGLCHQEQRQGRTVFLFPGLMESKVIRRCAYCGSQYSIREPLHKCSNCGGDLEIVRT
jgi:hypothetical protein